MAMRIRFVGIISLALMGAELGTAEELRFLGGGELDLRSSQDGATPEFSAYLKAEQAGFCAGFEGLIANDSVAILTCDRLQDLRRASRQINRIWLGIGNNLDGLHHVFDTHQKAMLVEHAVVYGHIKAIS